MLTTSLLCYRGRSVKCMELGLVVVLPDEKLINCSAAESLYLNPFHLHHVLYKIKQLGKWLFQ